MSALEAFANRVDPILTGMTPDEASAFLDDLDDLPKLLVAETTTALVSVIRALSTAKASAALDRSLANLGEIVALYRDVPAPQRAAYVTMRRMDVAKRQPKAPRAPRQPRESKPEPAPEMAHAAANGEHRG